MSSETPIIDTARLPALQRPREPRDPLIDPGKVRLIVILIIGILLIAGSLSAYVITSRITTVPNVVGLTEGAAARQLQRRRLKLEVGQRLYSTRPKGTVLSQSPAAGQRTGASRSVLVSISGGTGQVIVPELSGLTRGEALARLNALGLLVSEISQNSPDKAGTILSTSPVAGTRLRVGDTVVIHVAQKVDTITLVNYDLSGQSVVIEPRYNGKLSATDVTYDVAQRLSALVQAAGGKAVITRASTETTLSPAELSRRAADARPNASVTIMIDGVSSSALTVVARQQEGSLGQALFKELKWVSATALFSDAPVASAAPPDRSAAVSLGRSSLKADRVLLADDLFRDNVARALYMGLGKTLGK
ncbi:MAG: PASTA domain-containing protein [Actinomycetia bacterium]|nr:PASTA domain-containing protein [Actinomycetes bacterium]